MVCGLLRFARNDKKRTVIAKAYSNLVYSRLVIARTEGSWQSRNGVQLFIHGILFLFVFVFIISALWGLPPFVRGDVAKQQGG